MSNSRDKSNQSSNEISKKSQVYYQEGLTFIAKQDHKNAILKFDEALTLSPDYHPALTQRGVCYFVLGQYQKAISDLDRANQLDPKNYGIYYYRSSAYFNLNQLQKALENINAALRLLPNNSTYLASLDKIQKTISAQTHFKTVSELFDKKNYQQALQQANEAIRLDPTYAEAYCARGSCYREMKKFKEAVTDYEKALQLKPNYLWIYYNLALTGKLLNDNKQIVNNLDLFLKLDPGNSSAMVLRKQAQDKLQIPDFFTMLGFQAPSPVVLPNTQKYFSDMQTKWYNAAANGNFIILQQMVNTYPNIIHLSNPYGRTALHAAAATGQVAILEFLLSQGADLKAICKTDGHNAADYAILNNQYEALVFLTNKGLMALNVGIADYIMPLPFVSITATTIAANYLFINEGFNGVVDCTTKALHEEKMKTIQLATINTAAQADSALQAINIYLSWIKAWLAERLSYSIGFTDCAKPAIAYWEAVKTEIQKKKEVLTVKGKVQHYVASKGYIKLLKYWIRQGVGLTIVDSLGNTPLHVAAANGHLDCVKAMLEQAEPKKNYLANYNLYPNSPVLSKKEFIDKANNEGMTALHFAAINGHIDTMQYLMSHHANINAKTKMGFDVIQCAYYYKQTKVINWLKSIKQVSLHNETGCLLVFPHLHSSQQWEVTFASSATDNFSFMIKEDQATESHHVLQQSNESGISIVISSTLLANEIQKLTYLPQADRKSTAAAITGIKALTDFQQTFSQPADITKFVIKDKITDKNQEKTYHSGSASTKVTTSPESKTVEITIRNSPLDGAMIVNSVMPAISSTYNAFVCITKEFSAGNDIKSALKVCGAEQAQEIIKNGVTNIFSYITAEILGSVISTGLARTIGGAAGMLLFDSSPANPIEASIPPDKMTTIQQSSLSSTANVTTKLNQKNPASAQQTMLQTLTKEKQQNALYLQSQVKLAVKQAFSESVLLGQKPSVAYTPGTLNSPATFYSFSCTSPAILSSGGLVTDSHGNAVTASHTADYAGGSGFGPENWGREGFGHNAGGWRR